MSEKEVSSFFTNTIAQDLFHLATGPLISVGSTRTVFRGNNPSNVLKFETNARRFQNVLEWETWEIVRHVPKAKLWFAPCIDISPCGTILIQAFCRDMEEAELPIDIPSYFCDVKKENFGIFEGRVVCRDYGNSLLIDKGINNKMKKAEWL